MAHDITIPPAALEAGARAITMALILAVDEDCRALALTDDERTELARAAFLAIVEAWPGFHIGAKATIAPYIILPLPQEITLNAQNINALAVKSAGEEITLTEQEGGDE